MQFGDTADYKSVQAFAAGGRLVGVPSVAAPTSLNSRLLFTMTALAGMVEFPVEKLTCRRPVNVQHTIKIMGDTSPKSKQKKSTQKQAKAHSADLKKQQAIAAKQVAGKKN